MVLVNNKKSKKSKRSKKAAPRATFSFRRHLLPPFIGLAVMFVVFVGLNAQWIEAQLKYHFAKPVVTQVSTALASAINTKSPNPSAPPAITIPKISVNAPIIFEQNTAEWAIQLALRKGVDHYGNTANPGQAGNTVIFGHSSGQLWAPGDYKFVFTLLSKLQPKDQIIIDYKGTRYTYSVTSTEVILPTNLSILNQTSSVPSLSLVTCTPVGTSKYRLVVHASQVSPVPQPDYNLKPQLASTKAQPTLPGSAHGSLWHRLFGWL